MRIGVHGNLICNLLHQASENNNIISWGKSKIDKLSKISIKYQLIKTYKKLKFLKLDICASEISRNKEATKKITNKKIN